MTPHEMTALIGQPIGTSDWLEVSQARIDAFAAATGDFQFIHVDPERARLTPLGGTVAHGFLTLSLIPLLMETSDAARVDGMRMGLNYGGNKVRFLAPVHAGKRIRGHFRLIDLAEKHPGQWQQTFEATIEIESEDKPAMIAEWIVQFFV